MANLTQKKVAEKLNIKYQVYQTWENGTRNPKVENLKQLANIFNTTYEYLTDTEILPIYQKLSDDRKIKSIEHTKGLLSEQTEENKIIQFNSLLRPYHVIEQALSAGTGFGYTDDVSYSTVYWHEELKYDLATWISGNSMEPDFLNGEVALIKKQDQADYEGQVCAVDWDGNSYIKKVYMEEDGLVLRSINPIYDDKFASWDEQPRIIGIVTAHFKPEQKK